MNSIAVTPVSSIPLVVVRWIARAASVASIGLLAAFAFGEPGVPTLSESVALAMFPVGVAAGMIWAWWDELRGGLVTALCLAGFYVWLFARDGKVAHGPYFVLFAAPGLVLLACGLIEWLRRRG